MPAIPDKVKRIKQIRFQDLSTPQDHFETENRPSRIRPGGTALQSVGVLPPTSQSSDAVTKSNCTNFGRFLAVAVALGWVLINIAVIFSTDVEHVGSSWLAQFLSKLNPPSDTVQDQANAGTEEEPQFGVVGWSGVQHKFEVDESLGLGKWVGETLNTKSNGFHEPPQRTTHQGAAALSAGLTHNPEASPNNRKNEENDNHWLPQPEKILWNRRARPFRASTGGSDPDPNQRMDHWISRLRVPVDWDGVPSRPGRFDLELPRTAQLAKHLPFDRNVGSVVSKVPLGFSPN
eukprot:GHVN01017205.1.p1 GENE.GHVN01017205.1~~GHVN01017205.1.p1  ORF type:complete len:290 (-),score=34.24 GHVN01017205.1:33-902(-)